MMFKNQSGISFLLLFSVFIIVMSSGFVFAASCWQYTSVANGCTEANGCSFKSDSWGSWCEELSCWSLNNQSACSTTSIAGTNCTWSGGGFNFYCGEINCWTFSGTTNASCQSNSDGLSCAWTERCTSNGGGGSVNCWDVLDQSACTNTTGCSWGECKDRGCYDYTVESSCNAAVDPWSNTHGNCTWSNPGGAGTCGQNYCSNNYNQTACEATTGLNCIWNSGGWCQEVNCYSFKNQSTCEDANSTASIDCSWDGSFCSDDGCWNHDGNENTCNSRSDCTWSNWTTSGWCGEVNCWSWDSWNGGSEASCSGNSSIYELGCIWTNDSMGNASYFTGSCYQDISSLSCANITTERKCYDTFYCWWQANDWNDASAGGNCTTPTWGTGDYENVSTNILNDWNPGCYIFDNNETDCDNIIGCDYTSSACVSNSSGDLVDRGTNITNDGIKCSYINESGICNQINVLSTCCSWQNGSCSENRATSSCWRDIDSTPNGETACEDATSSVSCNALTQTPWYWPCKWDNTTSSVAKCTAKAENIWGNRTQNLVTIENRITCEAVGGRWVTENYCEGNVAVPTGRCEQRFDEERNCNKACFACEYKSDGTALDSSTDALETCLGSTLGYCGFTADTSAPNGFGYCEAKHEFRVGIAADCDSDCGACTYLGSPDGINGSKTPKQYCEGSNANTLGGGCKWQRDNSTITGGICLDAGEKVCADSCDRCNTQNDCTNYGRGNVANVSGSCKWQGSDNDGSCVANIAGDVEICWNGDDDDSDNLIDCADPGCYGDTFCGFVQGDCFNWADNTSCIDNSCEWVEDKWGSWCDFPGTQCWKEDGNESACSGQTNCEWQNTTGSTGWCEQDWSLAETCFGFINESTCGGQSDCTWTNDTWCNGDGSGSAWCNNNGGWCDHDSFVSQDCWLYSDNSSCGGTSGCSWRSDEWSQPICEVNWSGNCWGNTDSSSCTTAGCYWNSNGNWCGNSFDECWQQSSESSCNAISGSKCSWKSYSGGGGTCEASCYSSGTQSSCEAVSGCLWKSESGWCEEQQSTACFNSSSSGNENNCNAATGCKWRDPGWCSPNTGFGGLGTGGGVGGGVGECYKYDGNITECTNKTIINISCGWFPETNPFCEVNWATDCWSYSSVTNGCTVANGCWWNPDNNWCGNVADQCWSNSSLQNDNVECNNNAYCNSTIYGCEPTCFSQTTESDCGAVTGSTCKWASGWCNPAGVNDLFDTIEGGAPVPIGTDSSGDAFPASTDILGFGMKDMGDAYGFGVNVLDFTNSSICNKQKINSFGGDSVVGSGNETLKFITYLDTDGLTTGGCGVESNTTSAGYEFKLRYGSVWNASTSKAIETFTSYKCDNSKWKKSDIKISAWKKIMCSDMGGPMIAVEKGDLSRFPTLYTSTADMRVYVVTMNSSGSTSSPSDSAGPGWATPGAIDFDISSAFSYNADSAKFEDILKKGFVQGEDCFTAADDDNDGTVNCNDWDCQFSSACSSTGVNAVGYSDTKTPQVTGVKIEEYSDSALILYDTNKPANGTLTFYGNDSACSSLNTTVYDVGVTSSNVRQYKLWHKAEIFNDSSTSLSYALANDTQYYYKLEVCDDENKCAKSKCSSFYTAPTGKCGFCDFVTRIKLPGDWDVHYDVNQDGTYEHGQGLVCGPNSGMKTNYTSGRSVNIKLNSSDGATYFEFINASLTKSALNDKVRTISTTGDIISSSTTVGLTSDTRDKIINNLYPEICRIKVPVPAGGTCNALFHCDDSGENCVDKTSDSTLLDSTNCVWQIPNCEFSTYQITQPSGGSSGGSSGGGGGGSSSSSSSSSSGSTTTNNDGADSETESSDSAGGDAPEEEQDSNEKGSSPIGDIFKKSKNKVFWVVIGLVAIAGIVGVWYGVKPILNKKNLRKRIKVFPGKDIIVK
jgi:hypothetical protein